ncbi:MAG: hypothetical protein N2Z22_06885 [Turneriella sp.]|nr:hypothetical protein [Turneriella sp.]
MRSAVAWFLVLSVMACRLDRREEFDFSPEQPLRCGIFRSYYFVREVQEEVYPDLGLVLANARRLRLRADQIKVLTERARECTELCTVKKDQLRLMQEEIKQKLALNEIQGNLSLLAKEVRAFEAAKREWLNGHAQRYRRGLELLDAGQRAEWLVAENALKPLPVEP